MLEQASRKEISRELVVEMTRGDGTPEEKKFMLSAQEPKINAGALKQRFLNFFDGTAPKLESEEEADENKSYYLLGCDSNGKQTRFADAAQVDLDTYHHFQIFPRTAGGGA